MAPEKHITELLKGKFDLEVKNFEKWNPPIVSRITKQTVENQRRDWIALDVDFWLDPRLHNVTPAFLLFWVKLLCIRGTSGKQLSAVTCDWLQKRIGTQGVKVPTILAKLLELGLITLTKTGQDRQTDREDVGEISAAEAHLTERGIALFKKRLQGRYETEIQKAFIRWEVVGKPKGTPFQVSFNNWCDFLENNPGADSDKINWDEVCQ